MMQVALLFSTNTEHLATAVIVSGSCMSALSWGAHVQLQYAFDVAGFPGATKERSILLFVLQGVLTNTNNDAAISSIFSSGAADVLAAALEVRSPSLTLPLWVPDSMAVCT